MSDNAANRSLPSVSVNPEGYQTIMGEEPLGHSNPGHAWRRMEARLTYEGDSTGGYDCSAQNSADVENRIESDPPQAAGAEVPSQCRPAISLESRGSLDRGCVVESCIRGGVAEDISTILGVKKSPPPPPIRPASRVCESVPEERSRTLLSDGVCTEFLGKHFYNTPSRNGQKCLISAFDGKLIFEKLGNLLGRFSNFKRSSGSQGRVSTVTHRSKPSSWVRSWLVVAAVLGLVAVGFEPATAQSRLTISDASVTEGNSGSVNLEFRVRLSGDPLAEAVTVSYRDTGNGTATSGTDYTALSTGTLTFAAMVGNEEKRLTVAVQGDELDEPNETVELEISGASSNATILRATATGTITDDDAAPSLSISSPSVDEGNSGSANLLFKVTLSAASGKQVTVGYSATGGTAVSGTDYEALSAGTLTFAPGDTEKTVTVSVTGDTLDEPNETVAVTLKNPSSASVSAASATGTGTITDDDPQPSASISSPTVTEGDSGEVTLAFVVTLSAASARHVQLNYGLGSGTATRGTDFTETGTDLISFNAGETSKTISVAVKGDELDEPDETVVLNLRARDGGNATVGTGTGTGTITDDDPEPSLSISSPSVVEGDSGSANLLFKVTLSAESGKQVTVHYAEGSGGTATAGTDYTALSTGTLTFAAGDTEKTLTVAATGDTLDESNETVQVQLSGATNASISTATGTGTITDDDSAELSISSPSVVEGDSGSVDMRFVVTLSPASASTVTVGYADAGTGTATSGTDYTALSAGTLTFAAWETAKTVTVSVLGDTRNESNETVKVQLSSASGATIDSATGTGTITDDDARPSLSISSPTVTEGDSGSVNLLFKVTLSAASGEQVTVQYAEGSGGTATSGTDYTALTGGTLTFAAGDTEKTLTVAVTGDTSVEPDETIKITLSSATAATILRATGTGTITDDDLPSASISSPSVTEGDSGDVTLAFVVTLSVASPRHVQLNYGLGSTSTATSGTDFTWPGTNLVSFNVGETSKTIAVTVRGDELDEPDETVVVNLTARTDGNATVGTGTGTGTITDDDPEPSLSISSPSVGEGDSGSANLLFKVTLSAASGKPVTVRYAEGSGGTATAGTDYTALTGGTLSFAAGDTEKTITVTVTGDTLDESNETVQVQLSGATNASISTATGTGTITDDDSAELSISSPSVVEGSSGSVDMRFEVTLSPASASTVTVRYADAGTGTATSGTDYTALSAGTLTFAAGETAKTVTVSVTGDTLNESNETIKVQLSSASGATIDSATGTGTITDDDARPSISISSPTVTEGNSGSVNLLFKVTLSGASGKQVTVQYAEGSGGTATSGTDYTAWTGGTLTFAAGDTEKTLTVAVTGDTSVEPDETIKITLSSATDATILRATGTGTITDDDLPSASISSPTVTEGDSGETTLAFVVTLSSAASKNVFLNYGYDSSGTAEAGTDFKRTGSDLVSINRGQTSKTIAIQVIGDELDEPDETVVLTLRARADGNATVGTATGTGTITDDDPEPSLSISSPSVGEGDSGSANLLFVVSLSAASGKQVTVGYADAGSGTATSGTDYTAVAGGTLTFTAGETAKTVTVAVRGDTLDEAHETVRVSLSGASNASIGTATGTGTITDDDPEPSLSISSPSVGEGDSGSANLLFEVSLSGASGKQVTVGYADAGSGTATSGTDYAAVAGGTLTFAAGDTAKTVTVAVTGDTVNEAHETVRVTLSGASNASIATATGTGTITDDDGQPALSISSPSVGEGDSGSVNLLFEVSLSGASGQRVTVGYADAGSGTATSGTDYTAVAGGTLTFTAGETAKTVTVAVRGDTLDEAHETVRVTLSGAMNASIGTATGTGTITDDDPEPALSISSPSVGEGDSGSVNLLFEVSLSGASGQRVTVGYADAGSGTATSGADYTALAGGTLTFAAGETAKTVTVAVRGDTLDEAHETVRVSLSGAMNASIGTATGTGTITDDDPEPSLSISSPSVGEGDSGSANLLFGVSLSGASGKQVTVGYADAGSGTATSGTDYTAVAAGILTFAAGDTAKTVTVAVTGDTVNEAHETVRVTLSGASNASIATATGTGTITDDDGQPALSISSPSVGEGDSGSANLLFEVSLSGASGQRVTVGYADAGSGTATSGTDYTAVAGGTLTFTAGETAKTVTVAVRGDTLDEANETVRVTLSGAMNAGIGTATGTGTITDDDPEPSLSISSPSAGEGDSGSANLLFEVSLSVASGKQVTVGYADAGSGTATSGTDYTALAAGTLTFVAGETAKTVTVAVRGDTLDEAHETVRVTLSGASNAGIGTGTGTGTITDDDPEPSLSISSPSVGEGDSGSANLLFEVSLSGASGKQVTVGYADAGSGTATSGTDYTAVAGGTLTFAAGETAKTVTVAVTGDTVNEAHETVRVTLSGASNASIGTGTGTGTITDDDGQPALSISSPSVGEGDSGSANLLFAVSLSGASGQRVTVGYADAGSGTATSGTDYTAVAGGTLTFTAGETAKTVTVAVRGDTLDEAHETVRVTLSGAMNAGIGTGTGTGTITDDDPEPSLSISSPSVGEGDSGSANLLFEVSLSVASGKQVTVGYADAGSGTATSGTDYTAVAAGTLTFGAGETAKTVTVAVTGDTVNEAHETVRVSLSGASNASIGTATGTGTITDDDGQPALSISSPSVGEGDSGSANLLFEVSLSGASGQPVTVGYADAGSGTATSGTDYTAVAGGTLTFTAGETAKTVTVAVRGDTLDEAHETVRVTLSGAMNAGIGTATGTGTITDDDPEPSLSISSPSVGEGDSGSANLLFKVSLSVASGKQVTVGYADAGSGTATSGTDYTAVAGGTLTFAAGETAKTVTVAVRGDTVDEAHETVRVTLSGASNAGIGTGTGTGTITDDDPEPSLSISSPSVGEGDSGSANLLFGVSLSVASGKQVTVGYADAGSGTATSGTDYTAVAGGTLTFAAGETAKTVTVAVRGDTVDEAHETVRVSLSGASNASIGTATGTGTITDDDPEPSLSISSPSVGEGDSGSANLLFAVSLSAASGKQVTVGYADAGSGTATSGTDYTALAGGMLTFAAGETAKTVTVAVTGDTLDEAHETVRVTLSGASNASIGTATGTGTITDDDPEPSLSISSPRVAEGDSGSANLLFEVSLSVASGKQVTVGYADAGSGTATSGTDYTALAAGTLTFAAGETEKTITVAVIGDTLVEPDETIQVSLNGPANATLAVSTGTGEITNDDSAQTETPSLVHALTISSPSISEGDSGTSTLTFTVDLGATSDRQVTVEFADSGLGTASPGEDYAALTAGTLTFSPGVTTQTVDVIVSGDTDAEDDETVQLTLSGATSAVIQTSTGIGTILDDDTTLDPSRAGPSVSIASPNVVERDSGETTALAFAVTLSEPSSQEVTVEYSNIGTGSASAGVDYVAFAGGTLTFEPTQTSRTIEVTVIGDDADEPDETIHVQLSNATDADVAESIGTGTIIDDDLPAVSINSPSITEGDTDTSLLSFIVTLSAPSTDVVTVGYVDSGTGTATVGEDYERLDSGTLTFAAGETRQTVSVAVVGDTQVESDETVVVTISTAAGARITTATGEGTITDDDDDSDETDSPTVGVSIDSPSVSEGQEGIATLLFTVRLDREIEGPLAISYADAQTGSAVSGTDYEALPEGTLTFASGERRKSIAVSVIGDTADEADETVVIRLAHPGNASIFYGLGVGTIIDDDSVPPESMELRIDSPKVPEGPPGALTPLNFVVTLGAPNGIPVEVFYEDAGTGSASRGDDYVELLPGTLTFSPGDRRKTISITVRGDEADEADETVQLALRAEGHGRDSSLIGTGTIADDDHSTTDPGDEPPPASPELLIDSPSLQEGPPGTTSTLEFTVTLSAAFTQPLTVEYAESDSGTATAGTDYVALPASKLTFAAGETSKAITLTVIGDEVVEPDETVVVEALADTGNGRDVPVRGTATIINDDVDLVPTFGDATVPSQRYVEGVRIDPLVLPAATGGTGDLAYSLSPIPPDGLVFNPSSRRISGTPAVPLEATFYEFTATDADGDTATLAFTIEVSAAGAVARRKLGGVNQVLLPEVARAWTQVTAEAIAGRVERVATGADEGPVGQSLALIAETLHRSERTLDTAQERQRARMELAGTQPFALNLGGVGGARLGFWGDGDFRSLSGEFSPIGWSGTTYAGGAGLDVRMGSTMLAGIAASRFEGAFDYGDRDRGASGGGTHTSRVTGLHPYVGWTLGSAARMWATAGFGAAEIEIDDEEFGRQVSDGRLRSGALGGRFRLFSTGDSAAATRLDLRAEGQFGRMEIEGNGDLIEGLSVGVHRLRAAMEGSRVIDMGQGRTLTPSVALGVRRDGGDGRTGTGAELSGSVDYADPATGWGVEANGRVLLAHTGDAGEWGFGASISYDPGQDGRGLALKVEPRFGTAENGMQRLWDEGTVDARRFEEGAYVPQSRSESEVGYGLLLRDGRCLLTPYSGVSIGGQGYREYRLGSRFEIGPDFGLALESSRRERERMVPDYRLAIEMRLAW